eukprot:scaffold78563_cov32-Attheya_sp.AAC.2
MKKYNPKKTSAALARLLLRTSQYTEYISYLLDRLCAATDNTEPIVIDQLRHPFRPIDVSLPHDNNGCVYILVALRDHKTTYIGQTHNLGRRLGQHNSGCGSRQTSDIHLRPWTLLAYVVGFEDDTVSLKSFETQWETARDQRLQRDRAASMNAEDVAEIAISVIAERIQNGSVAVDQLRFVRFSLSGRFTAHSGVSGIALVDNREGHHVSSSSSRRTDQKILYLSGGSLFLPSSSEHTNSCRYAVDHSQEPLIPLLCFYDITRLLGPWPALALTWPQFSTLVWEGPRANSGSNISTHSYSDPWRRVPPPGGTL